MRLLNTTTLHFHNFENDNERPEYAILSHTWGKEEITYQEMATNAMNIKDKQGFEKIKSYASRARADSIEYIWIDTCCIDKSSSSELTEAINSMFHWYKGSTVCYAYLADVSAPPQLGFDPTVWRESNDLWMIQFKKSRWFTRGWTLQELIAPPKVLFYSADWTSCGSRTTFALDIQQATGIPAKYLDGHDLDGRGLATVSISARMSWAASRETSRIEDQAYCLMGLFNVNMPLLYGERERAFARLQEEIMKQSTDMTLFCWTDPKSSPKTHRSILGRSPAEFSQSAHLIPQRWSTSKPYQMTNKGLVIDLYLTEKDGSRDEYYATIPVASRESSKNIQLTLKRTHSDEYIRLDSFAHRYVEFTPHETETRTSTIYLLQNLPHDHIHTKIDLTRVGGIIFTMEGSPNVQSLTTSENWCAISSRYLLSDSFNWDTVITVIIGKYMFDGERDRCTLVNIKTLDLFRILENRCASACIGRRRPLYFQPHYTDIFYLADLCFNGDELMIIVKLKERPSE